MKKIIVFLSIFLLCGCTSTYKLDISNDKFSENINIFMPYYKYQSEQNIDPETGAIIEEDNQIDSFLNNKISALFSKKSYYKKKVVYDNDTASINMKYIYSEKEFEDSNSLKLCFDDYVFKYDSSYYIRAKGQFYCLYSDSVDIEIHTKNKVIKNNASEVNGNSYIWHINQENAQNVDILFEVEKGISRSTIIISVTIVVILLFALMLYFIVHLKNKNNNSI